MPKNFEQPPGRPVPINLTQLVELDFRQSFGWSDRLRLAIGYNLDIKLRLACQHHPGRIGEVIEVKTTRELRPAIKPNPTL